MLSGEMSAIEDDPAPTAPPCIVPSLDVAHAAGRDLVWCASMDLAWKELCELVGGPVALRGVAEGDPAAEIVRALDRSEVSTAFLDSPSYVALAGMHTQAWVDRASELMRARFGAGAPARLFDRDPKPDRFVAYAFLSKALRFPVPLMRQHGRLLFCRKPVESFGLWDSDLARPELRAPRVEEILVHHHRFLRDEDFDHEPGDDDPTEEFVVEILAEDRGDRLIVARGIQGKTLGDTARWAMGKLREDVEADPRSRLSAGERFEVPCVDFDLVRRYHELYDKAIGNPGFEAQSFGAVEERIRFRLDEGGALLVSEARMGGLCLPPRSMDCDGPFLILILRRGAPLPALAIWIETTSLLVRADRPDRPS
jgi:hypothetical protein